MKALDGATRVRHALVVLITYTFFLTSENNRFVGVATSADPSVAARDTTNQLFLVSTRGLRHCNLDREGATRLSYWRCKPDGRWQSSNLEELLASDDPTVTTCIYVHGNRVTGDQAFSNGRLILDRLKTQVSGRHRFRLVVFSWPSERIGCRQRPDLQIKAFRSEKQGFYLAALMDQIHPNVPISLFGFSYGPRTITSALHLLGGGTVHGRKLILRLHAQRVPVRAVLMAAGEDPDWLLPGHHHGRALENVQHLLVLTNRHDPVLRWYPWLYGRGGPAALGLAGLPRRKKLGPYTRKVHQMDITDIVGRSHTWLDYAGSRRMLSRILPYLFEQVRTGTETTYGQVPASTRPTVESN